MDIGEDVLAGGGARKGEGEDGIEKEGSRKRGEKARRLLFLCASAPFSSPSSFIHKNRDGGPLFFLGDGPMPIPIQATTYCHRGNENKRMNGKIFFSMLRISCNRLSFGVIIV